MEYEGKLDALNALACGAGLGLAHDERGLAIFDGPATVRGDFSRMRARIAPERLGSELVVRAAKVKGASAPLAVDATAGLGEDSLLLAAAGFRVTMFERNPVIAALLEDALARAARDSKLAGAVARMELIDGDSIEALPLLAGRDMQPDIVLLDPMFPDKRKSSAAKKKLQLLQRLERPCEDEGALLDAALAACPRKVVVKRPVKGPYLAGRKPDYSLAGKAIRFDCIVLPSQVSPNRSRT